ncbi:MAG TPA: hypothetical protein VKS22_16655 [Candidatus Binataceae bacterium]|nr:hypothetical protein [Candidatus Binataceae bacterium]
MNLKRPMILLSATLLMGALSAPVMAQGEPLQPPRPTHFDKHHKYADKFGDFLDSHPGMEEQLNHDPRLVDDPAYLKSNPDLKAYLEHHPGVREKFKSHPTLFLRRVHRTQGTPAKY